MKKHTSKICFLTLYSYYNTFTTVNIIMAFVFQSPDVFIKCITQSPIYIIIMCKFTFSIICYNTDYNKFITSLSYL